MNKMIFDVFPQMERLKKTLNKLHMKAKQNEQSKYQYTAFALFFNEAETKANAHIYMCIIATVSHVSLEAMYPSRVLMLHLCEMLRCH